MHKLKLIISIDFRRTGTLGGGQEEMSNQTVATAKAWDKKNSLIKFYAFNKGQTDFTIWMQRRYLYRNFKIKF